MVKTMRKIFFMLFFIITIFNISAQNNFMGYEKVTWLSTISTLLREYPEAFEIPRDSPGLNLKRNERAFREVFFGKNTEYMYRTFYFKNNELYKVEVLYNNFAFEPLLEEILDNYGEPMIRDRWNDDFGGYDITYFYSSWLPSVLMYIEIIFGLHIKDGGISSNRENGKIVYVFPRVIYSHPLVN